MRAIFGILILLTVQAHAHGGLENETEVRLFPDRMRVMVRTTPGFAWRLLGDSAPLRADEAGRNAARPLLADSARSLFEVTSGKTTLTLGATDCIFEPDGHVAFVLNYPGPTEWPLVFQAKFFVLLGELDHGTIRLFDQRADRFARDIGAITTKEISLAAPSFSFSPPTAMKPEAVVPSLAAVPSSRPAERGKWQIWPWMVVVALALAWVVHFRLAPR